MLRQDTRGSTTCLLAWVSPSHPQCHRCRRCDTQQGTTRSKTARRHHHKPGICSTLQTWHCGGAWGKANGARPAKTKQGAENGMERGEIDRAQRNKRVCVLARSDARITPKPIPQRPPTKTAHTEQTPLTLHSSKKVSRCAPLEGSQRGRSTCGTQLDSGCTAPMGMSTLAGMRNWRTCDAGTQTSLNSPCKQGKREREREREKTRTAKIVK